MIATAKGRVSTNWIGRLKYGFLNFIWYNARIHSDNLSIKKCEKCFDFDVWLYVNNFWMFFSLAGRASISTFSDSLWRESFPRQGKSSGTTFYLVLLFWRLRDFECSTLVFTSVGVWSFRWKEKWGYRVWRICSCAKHLPSLCSNRRKNWL